jgi:hypothetical protein
MATPGPSDATSAAEELHKLTPAEYNEYNKLAVLMDSYVCAATPQTCTDLLSTTTSANPGR